MKWVIGALLLLAAGPAQADITHRLSSSIQLSVDGAATQAQRIGSTYSVSGNNIRVSAANNSVFGGLTAGSATAAPTMKVGTYDINTAGSAYSFSESFNQGDGIPAIGSGVDVSAGVVADMPAFGIVTTQSGGVAGNLAGTINSAGAVTATSGGAGTQALGQFVSEISVK